MQALPPKFFISYSQDSESRKERVMALAERLCCNEVDARNQYIAGTPTEG
jgi:hypothetical protein